MPSSAAIPPKTVMRFDDIEGWHADNHDAALSVFLKSSDAFLDPAWKEVADAARSASNARHFFEQFFSPVALGEDGKGKMTGYYEPELSGAKSPEFGYTAPIYRAPPELHPQKPWLTRKDIDLTGALSGRGLELAWLEDPVDVFFLQVQGSGRIRLPDGQSMRVGYAAKNNHSYTSIGSRLIEQGYIPAAGITAQKIKDWLRTNPDAARQIMWDNESYVFFREIDTVSPEDGPIGTAGCPVTAMRTVAVDPEFTPLGAPVWVDCETTRTVRMLTIAQDTGSAIIGPSRVDLFVGTGGEAGRFAGAINHPGHFLTLLPKTLLS